MIVSVLVLGALLLSAPVTRSTPPNIVLVLADDMGLGTLETEQSIKLGHYVEARSTISTKNIRALSQDGIAFRRSYADSPICAASRYALLTGIHVGSAYSRVRGNNGKSVDHFLKANGEVVFAELLQQKGYQTAMFGKWGFQDKPSECGFDYYLGSRSHVESMRYFYEKLYEDDGVTQGYTTQYTPNNHGIKDGQAEMTNCNRNRRRVCDYIPDVLHKKALKWLEQTTAAPFFLFIPTIIPHDGGFSGQNKANYFPISEFSKNNCSTCADYDRRGIGEPFEDYTEHMAAYGSSVTNYFDVHVQELVTKLKDLGKYNNTLFIILSDNGAAVDIAPTKAEKEKMLKYPMYVNGQFRGYKRQLFEGGVSLPNLFVWPDRIRDNGGSIRAHDILVSNLAPSLLQLAGYDNVPVQFGTSFASCLISDTQCNDGSIPIHNEICLDDNGVLGRHTSCDFSVTFGDGFCHRVEWTARYPSSMDLSILTYGKGFGPSATGNLTADDLRVYRKSDYTPSVRNICNDPEESGTEYSDSIRLAAEQLVVSYRVVATGSVPTAWKVLATTSPSSSPTSRSPSISPTELTMTPTSRSPSISPTELTMTPTTASPVSLEPTPTPMSSPITSESPSTVTTDNSGVQSSVISAFLALPMLMNIYCA